MSKFSEFLNQSKKIRITSEIPIGVHAEPVNYFLKSLSKIKTIAILSVFVPIVSNAMPNNDNIGLNKTEEVKEIINYFSDQTNYNLNTSNIIISENKKGASTYASHEMGDMKTCKISIALDNNGDLTKLGRQFEIKDQSLYQDMVLNHELSHCITDKKFQYSGMSKNSEKWMNDWVVGEYVSENQIKNIFEENFADTYGALIFLNKHGFSDKSIDFIKDWSEKRELINLTNERNGHYFEGHNTYNSLNVILDNIDKIKELDKSEYKKVADELASKSVLYILNKNRKVEEEFKINELGEIIFNKTKKNVGIEGLTLVNTTLASYKYSIRDISIKLVYDLKDGKNLSEEDSGAYSISKDGVLFFNDTSWAFQDKKVAIKTLDKQLAGNYYDNVFKKYKEEHNYKDFTNELSLKLNQPRFVIKLNLNFNPKILESKVNDIKLKPIEGKEKYPVLEKLKI